ncbi:MAG: type II toxin-antitoxin system HicB family antitoxin [Candidatus Baltobacteraceae bacterium]
MKYAIMIERGQLNYSAFAPDLPGCVAVGDTLADAKREIRSAVVAHIANLRKHGDPIPPAITSIDYAEVA